MAKLDSLFKKLIETGGSDLHLEQGQMPKMRLHGSIQPIEGEGELTQDSLTSMMEEITSKEAWSKFDQTGDIDFAYSLGEEARFRANYFRHFYGFGAIFRIIPSKILTLEELGMPKVLSDFTKIRSGVILVTGPTGSGKSTTLAAIINHFNETRQDKIITIEEPVEFMHNNKKCMIIHREVGLDTESFASGLRGAIKSDVNIILVGEMRDQETIKLALTAAEMGILVFGTLHTNSAAKTIDRIIDVFPANQKSQIRTVLANTLQAVVSQQLLKSADKTGRHAAYEILLRTSSLPSTILSGETMKLTSEMQMNRSSGMITMDDCLKELVQSGKVTKDDAFLKALDKNNFMNAI